MTVSLGFVSLVCFVASAVGLPLVIVPSNRYLRATLLCLVMLGCIRGISGFMQDFAHLAGPMAGPMWIPLLLGWCALAFVGLLVQAHEVVETKSKSPGNAE